MTNKRHFVILCEKQTNWLYIRRSRHHWYFRQTAPVARKTLFKIIATILSLGCLAVQGGYLPVFLGHRLLAAGQIVASHLDWPISLFWHVVWRPQALGSVPVRPCARTDRPKRWEACQSDRVPGQTDLSVQSHHGTSNHFTLWKHSTVDWDFHLPTDLISFVCQSNWRKEITHVQHPTAIFNTNVMSLFKSTSVLSLNQTHRKYFSQGWWANGGKNEWKTDEVMRIKPRPIHWPLFVLGRKRPIHYVASVELPPSIAIIMYGRWGPTRLRGATVKNFWSITKNSCFHTTNSWIHVHSCHFCAFYCHQYCNCFVNKN